MMHNGQETDVLQQAVALDAEILSNRAKLSSLLLDLLNGDRLTRNILMMAYDEGIPGELSAGKTHAEDLFRYQKLLIANYGINRDAAHLAVAAWGQLFDVSPASWTQPEKEEAAEAADPPVSWVEADDDSYEYEVIDGGIRLTRFVGFDEPEIQIPNRIGTQKVLEIGDNAFQGCIGIETVIISDGIEKIGDDAFKECRSLSSVVLPETLQRIGANAFHFTALRSVRLPDSVADMGDECFSLCTNLEEVFLPKKLKEIPRRAFNYCRKLKQVHFQTGLEVIGDFAFDNCDNLLDIVLPNGLLKIGSGSFKALGEVCSFGKSTVQVPASVTEICPSAFGGWPNNLTIRCFPRSYAMKYARENSIRCERAAD